MVIEIKQKSWGVVFRLNSKKIDSQRQYMIVAIIVIGFIYVFPVFSAVLAVGGILGVIYLQNK